MNIPIPSRARLDAVVKVPLWTKLGAMFGGVYGLLVAGYGYYDWTLAVEEVSSQRRSELETLAAVVAAGVDADTHATFSSEADRGRPEFASVASALRLAIERSPTVTWGATVTRDERGRWRYVVDGSSAAPYPVGFPIFDGIAERDLAFSGRLLYIDALIDESGTWHTALAPIRGSDGGVIALVELASDADRDDLVLQGKFRRTLLQFAAAVGGGVLLSFAFGRLLSRNLRALAQAVAAVEKGQLDARVAVRTNDEIGLLAATFNRMVEGLKEREFIRDTFGRFVNPEVVAQIIADRGKLKLGGESREVTVLMSDLRGFTALSEELGPERMVALLNRYLSRMTAVVERHGGNVAEMLGDGLVILFGAPVQRPDDPARAVRCALDMHRELASFNTEEGRRLQMGIGIDTGLVVAGNIGGESHMKYGVVGAAINVAARLESFTLGNQILVTEATFRRAGPLDVDAPLEFRAKGRREPLRAYPVRASGDLRMPDDLAHLHADVRLQGLLWRVTGKVVEPSSHPILILRLEPEAITIKTDVSLQNRDQVKLSFEIDRGMVDDLYATVEVSGHERALLHITSIRSEARSLLEAYISEQAGEATGPRLE